MFRKTLIFTLLSFCLLSFSQCATIIHGSRQRLFLTCDPKIAEVYLDGIHVGQTPMMVSLKRNVGHKLKFQLEGYTTYSVGLRRKIDGWVWGNILFGGFPGVAIDAVTGSIYRLSPSDLYPELHPLSAGGAARELSIMVTLHPDPSWEKIGQLTAAR